MVIALLAAMVSVRFGENSLKVRAAARRSEPPPDPSDFGPEGAGGARGVFTVDTAYHQISLLCTLEATIAALERDIARATRRVWIEIFIFRADAFGERMVRALSDAASRGVDVRVLYDSLGSRTTPQTFFTQMRQQGIDVRSYRPWHVALRALRLWPRDHARILCIDDVAYTGGIGFGNEWLPRDQGGLGWHDLCSRVRGPVVEACARCFQDQWRRGDAEDDCGTAQRSWPDLAFVADSPLDAEGVYPIHREAVQHAKRRIWIENAYFAPPKALLEDLFRAAARGVDVQVIVPSDSDVPSIARAARAEYPEWLEHGIAVYEYLPGVTHAKVALVDDEFCTVGSFNINPTSLVCSRESNLFVFDRAFVAGLADQFERDRAQCQRVTKEGIRRLGVVEKLKNHFFRTGVRLFERLSSAAGHPWS